MTSILVPKALSHFNKAHNTTSVFKRVNSPIRSKSISSYLDTNARYLKVAPASLPKQLNLDSFISQENARVSNARALDTMAELMNLAPNTTVDPKEVGANFVLEQILEQSLEVCSGKGYVKPGVTEHADQWHEVDIVGVSNDAFCVLFPQLEMFRQARIHSIIIEDLQVKRAPFALETGVEDIAESSEPGLGCLSDDDVMELFKLSFRSEDKNLFRSPAGVYHIRSDKNISAFLESRKRDREVMLANSRALAESQRLPEHTYPSTLDLSSNDDATDMNLKDLELTGVESATVHPEDTSDLSIFTITSKPKDEPHSSKLHEFQFHHFFDEEIPKVSLSTGECSSHKNNCRDQLETSETDIPLSQLHGRHTAATRGYQASVLLSSAADQKKINDASSAPSPQHTEPVPAEDSSRFVSHSFDILSTLDVLERRDREAMTKCASKGAALTAQLPKSFQEKQALPMDSTHVHESSEKVAFQYIDRSNQIIVRDVSKQFLQKFSRIHLYQRMKESFEAALRKLNQLVEEKSTANRPYLDFLSTAYIGHTLFYNLKTRLSEDYCIDCIAEIEERRLRVKNRERDYHLFISTLQAIKDKSKKLHDIRSKSVCGFTSVVTAPHLSILPSIYKDDQALDKIDTKKVTPCAATTVENEDTEEYMLALMRLRQRRERVYDHFESMIVEHNQVRSSAVELCLSAINSSRSTLEGLINPALKRTAKFDGFAALNNLYKSYLDHALKTDFATEVIEQADKDPSHELYWCARQLLKLKHASYRNYQKHRYPDFCPRRREAFENARTALLENKIFLGTSEYKHVFNDLMATVQEHLQYLVLTPELLVHLQGTFIPKISDYLFANMVFQTDMDKDTSSKSRTGTINLQNALQKLPGRVTPDRVSYVSETSVRADNGRQNRPNQDLEDPDDNAPTVNQVPNPVLKRPVNQELIAGPNLPILSTSYKPKNAYEWIQRRYWQIQNSREQDILRRKEDLIRRDAEEAAKSASILMTKDFSYKPGGRTQAEEIYEKIFKFPVPGETNFMEKLSIYLANCFVLLYEVLFPFIQESLMLNFSDLAFEQTNKKIKAYCNLTGISREALAADIAFDFQCQALEENRLLFRKIQKKVEILLFKTLHTYVMEDIYPQWAVFILLLFHGADRDMRYIAQSKALSSFSYILNTSRFNDEYMGILKKAHDLNVTLGYTKLYTDVEQLDGLSMSSLGGFIAPNCATDFTSNSPLAIQLNKTLADAMMKNISLISDASKSASNVPRAIVQNASGTSTLAAAQQAKLATSIQNMSETSADEACLFTSADVLAVSVQRIQNITEMHDFIYSQPTKWYFTSRIITDVKYLNREEEVQFSLSETRMKEIISLFTNTECVLSAVKNQRGLITNLLFTPSPSDIFSSLPMFVYDLVDFYSSCPIFADNLFPDPAPLDKDPHARPFGAKYNIPTTTDHINNFTFEAIARLGNDEPLQRVIHDVITTDESLPIRSGSDLIVTLGSNSPLPIGIMHQSMKRTTTKQDALKRNLLKSRGQHIASRSAAYVSGRTTKPGYSSQESPGESQRRARSKLTQYRIRNASPPTVPIRTSQVVPEGDIPFMDMTGKSDLATVANISFNIKTRNTAYSQQVASFFDSHGRVGTYMEARKCNRLHYEPPTILYRLANLTKHAALNLKNYLDMVLTFLMRYAKESLKFAEKLLDARDIVPTFIVERNWQVESLLNRTQTRIKEYYKAARMSLHATFKDRHREEKLKSSIKDRPHRQEVISDPGHDSGTPSAPLKRQLFTDGTAEPNGVFNDDFIDKELPFVYEAALLSQFLRSDSLLAAFTADYVPGSAPPEVLLSQMMSIKNKASHVSKALLVTYHLYDGFWCLTIMPTECFFGTLKLDLRQVIVRLRHIYENVFLLAVSRIDDYVHIASRVAQKCIQATQLSFGAAKFSTPEEIGRSFNLFRTFMRNMPVWGEYFGTMQSIENHLSEVAYGTKIGAVYANLLSYRIRASKMLFANQEFLPKIASSLHTVHQIARNVISQIEGWVCAASETIFPRVVEMFSLTSHDKSNCDRNVSEFRRRFANSICRNLSLPFGIDSTQTCTGASFQQLLYASIWVQSGLPFLSKKSIQDSRLILQQSKLDHRVASPFQFFERPQTIHPIHISTVFLEMEDLIKRLIELLQITNKSNCEILGFHNSSEYKDLSPTELFTRLESAEEFTRIDKIDYVLFGDSHDISEIGTKIESKTDEVRLAEIRKKKLAYYSKLLKRADPLPVRPENIRLIISESPYSPDVTTETRLLSLLPLVSLTCKLILLSDDLNTQIEDWFSRPINTISIPDMKIAIIHAIDVALSFLASVGDEIAISSIAHTVFEKLSGYRQQFIILFVIKASLDNMQVGFGYDVTAYDTFQPYNNGDITFDEYLGIDSREPLSISLYVKDMLSKSQYQLTDDVIARKAVDIFTAYTERLHFAMNTYCIKTRIDKLIQLQHHEVSMSILSMHESILLDSFLLPVFCDLRSDFSLLAEPDFLCTEFSKVSDASSYLIPSMRPVVRTSKTKGRSGIGKFLTTTNCAGCYSYKPIVAKSLAHDLHLPPLKLLKMTSAIRSLRKLRYLMIGGSERMLMQSLNSYQTDLLTSFTSYHTDSMFDLEWLSSSTIISYRNATTGTLFSKPISCYNICKPEIDRYITNLAQIPIETCLHNALEQTSDTASQIEWASVIEALGFALADLRAMDSSSRVKHILQTRLDLYWTTLEDAFVCSSFYRDAYEHSSTARYVFQTSAPSTWDELYTTENTIYLHAHNLKDLLRVRKLHQGAKIRPKQPSVPCAGDISPFISGYVTPHINTFITRLKHFQFTILRGLYEQQLWMEPIMSHLYNINVALQLVMLQWRAFRELSALNICLSLNHSASASFDPKTSLAIRVSPESLKESASNIFCYKPFIAFPDIPESFTRIMTDLIMALKYASVSRFNANLSFSQLTLRKTSRQGLWTLCSDIFNAQAAAIEICAHVCGSQLLDPLRTQTSGRRLLFSAIVEVALYETYYSPECRPRSALKMAELTSKAQDSLPFIAIPLPQRIIDAISTILACCGYMGYEFVAFKLLYPTGAYVYYIDGILQRSRYAQRWTKTHSAPQSSSDQLLFTKDSISYSLLIDPARRVLLEKEAVEYLPLATPLCFQYLHLLFTTTTIAFINQCLSLSFARYTTQFAELLQTELLCSTANSPYRNELSYFLRGLPLRITIHTIRKLMLNIQEGVIYQHKDSIELLDNLSNLVSSLRQLVTEHKKYPILTFDKTYTDLILERALHRLSRLHDLHTETPTTYIGDPLEIDELYIARASDPSYHPAMDSADVDSLCASSFSDEEDDVMDPEIGAEQALTTLRSKLDHRLEQTAHSQLKYNVDLCRVDRQFNRDVDQTYTTVKSSAGDDTTSRVMTVDRFLSIGQTTSLIGFSDSMLEASILLPHFSNSRSQHILDTLNEMDDLVSLVRSHMTKDPDTDGIHIDQSIYILPSFLSIYSCCIVCPVKELEKYEASLSQLVKTISTQSLPKIEQSLYSLCQTEIGSISSFHNEVYSEGGLLGRLGTTPLEIDAPYFAPSFRGLASFNKVTELLLLEHFAVFVTPTLSGYSDLRVLNFFGVKLPLHTAYNAIFISAASRAFSASDILKFLAMPTLVVIRDITSDPVRTSLAASLQELADLFATISTLKTPGRLIIWDPSLTAAPSEPPVYELSPLLRTALSAAQIPLSSHYIVLASDLFEYDTSKSTVSLTQPIVCLAKLLSGYTTLPKFSFDTIKSFISQSYSCSADTSAKLRNSYRMLIAIFSLQCCSSRKLSIFLEAVSSVIGKTELGIDFTGKNLGPLKAFLGVEFWGTKVLTKTAPTLSAFVHILTPNLRTRTVHKLTSISVIGPTIDTRIDKNSELTDLHVNCSTHILSEVLGSVCLPCIHCPNWVELFYEQFYAADCRALVPLNTKGWGIVAPLAYSILNRTDNLVHGLYLGVTDFNTDLSNTSCLSVVEKIFVQPTLTHGFDLLTDTYTTELLLLSLIRILTDFQLSSNTLSLKALLNESGTNDLTSLDTKEELFKIYKELDTVPVISAIRVIRNLSELHTSYNGEIILDSHCIYVLVIHEQHISVTSDRYYHIMRILSARKEHTTKVIVLTNCRAIYSLYVELGISTESPLAQELDGPYLHGMLSHAHLLYEFASTMTYANIVASYKDSMGAFSTLEAANISATMFEETLSNFVFTVEQRISAVNLAECLKILLIPILYIPLEVYKLVPTLSTPTLFGIVTIYLYLLQLYSVIIAKPKLGTLRACIYPHYSFECNIDFLMITILVSNGFSTSLTYLIAILFSFAVTAVKLFLLCSTDHIFNRELLLSKLDDHPAAALSRYHNKCLCDMLQLVLLEKKTKTQYECAMNKISSEFNQPLFECTQTLSLCFKDLIHLLNSPGDSQVHSVPYLYLLPQFPDLCASKNLLHDSYASVLAIRTIVSSYKHSKPETINLLRRVTFELTHLPYPKDSLADTTNACIPKGTNVDLLLYQAVICQHTGLDRTDYKGLSLAYCLAASVYFCRPLCIVASLFEVQSTAVLKHAYPLIKQDCALTVHSEYVSLPSMASSSSSDILLQRSYLRITKLHLRDETDIRVFLSRHQSWFCLTEGCGERLAIAFVRTIIVIEVECPEVLVSGFLFSFAYHQLIQMPDSLGHIMTYKMLNVCPVINICLTTGQQNPNIDTLNLLSHLSCPYVIADCYASPELATNIVASFTPTHQALLYILQAEIGTLLDQLATIHLCKRIAALPITYTSLLPILQAFSQMYSLYLYSNASTEQCIRPEHSLEMIDNLLNFVYFQQFGIQVASNNHGSTPQHLIETIVTTLIPSLSSISIEASSILANSLSSEPSVCPVFSKNYLLQILSVHINAVHMRNLFNRITFHYAGSPDRREKILARMRQAATSSSNDNLLASSNRNNPIPSFSLDSIDMSTGSSLIALDKLLKETFHKRLPPAKLERLLSVPYISGIRTPISIVISSYLSYDEFVFALSRLTCSEVKVPMSSKRPSISSIVIDLGGICGIYPSVDISTDQTLSQLSSRERILMSIRAAIGSILRLSPSSYTPANARKDRTDTYLLRASISYYDEQRDNCAVLASDNTASDTVRYLFDTSATADEYSASISEHSIAFPVGRFLAIPSPSSIIHSNIQDVQASLYTFVAYAGLQPVVLPEYNRVMIIAPVSLLLGTSTLRILLSFGEMSSSDSLWQPSELSDILSDFTTNTSVSMPTIPLLNSIIATRLSIFIFDDLNIMDSKVALNPDLQRLRTLATVLNLQDYSHILPTTRQVSTESFNLDYFYAEEAFGEGLNDSDSSEVASPLLGNDIHLLTSPSKPVTLLPSDLLVFTEATANSTNPYTIMTRLRCSYLLKYMWRLFSPGYTLPQNIVLALFGSAGNGSALSNKSIPSTALTIKYQLESMQKSRITLTDSSTRVQSRLSTLSTTKDLSAGEFEPAQLDTELQQLSKRILLYCNLIYRILATGAVRENPVAISKKTTLLSDKFIRGAKEPVLLATDPESVHESSCHHSESQSESPRRLLLDKGPGSNLDDDPNNSNLIKVILDSLPQAIAEFTVLKHYVSIELMTSLASTISNNIVLYYSKEQLSIQDSAIALANLQHHISSIQTTTATYEKRTKELDDLIQIQETDISALTKRELELKATANNLSSEKEALALSLDTQLEDVFLTIEPCRIKIEEAVSLLYRLFHAPPEPISSFTLSESSVELLGAWFGVSGSALQAPTLSLDTALSIELTDLGFDRIVDAPLSSAVLAFLEGESSSDSSLDNLLHHLGDTVIEYRTLILPHMTTINGSAYASYHKVAISLALTKTKEELVKAQLQTAYANLEGYRRERAQLETQKALIPEVGSGYVPQEDISMLISKRAEDELHCRRMLHLAALYGSLISACILFGFHHLSLFTAMLDASFSKHVGTPLCTGCQLLDYGAVCHACHNCRCFCRCTRVYQSTGAYVTNTARVLPLLCADISKKEQLMNIITQIFGEVCLTKSSLQYRLALGHTALLEYISCVVLCQIPSRAPIYVSGNIVHSIIAEAVSGSPGYTVICMKSGNKLVDDTEEFYTAFVSTLQETLSANTHSVILLKIETINWKALDLLGALTYDFKTVAKYGNVSSTVDHNFSKYRFAAAPSTYHFFVTWGPELTEVFRSVSTRLSLPNLFLFSQASFVGSNLQNLSTCILDPKTASRTHSLASSMTIHRENFSASILSFFYHSYFTDLIALRLEQESLIKQAKLGMKQFTTMHLDSNENAVLTMLPTIQQQLATQTQYISSISSIEKKLLALIKQRDAWTRGSDSAVSTATQTLLAFSNYLARLSVRYPALSTFWAMLSPESLQKTIESLDDSLRDTVFAGSFYKLMLYILLPLLTRTLPMQQCYLTTLALMVIGELSARSALPSTITTWETILKASGSELDKLVAKELSALLPQAKTYAVHSSILTCLGILSEENTVSTQLIDNLSPIISALRPQCIIPQSDHDFLNSEQPHFIKGGSPILLFAEDPVITCNALAGKLLRTGRSITILAASLMSMHSTTKSTNMSWVRTLMTLEEPFYSDEFPRATTHKISNDTFQTSSLSTVTILICQSIEAVELVLRSAQTIPGRIVLLLWTGYAEANALRGSTALLKLLAAYPNIVCVHSRGSLGTASKSMVYEPPLTSLTRSRLYGQQVLQQPYKHSPLAWLNLALDFIVPALTPELTLPLTSWMYLRLERLSLLKTVVTEEYCPLNTVIEDTLFLGDGVASKFSPATIVQYKQEELIALLDGSLFKQLVAYVLDPLCLTNRARHLVTLYIFCLWLFTRHLRKEDAVAIATKVASFSLGRVCDTHLGGTMRPRDQLMAIVQSFNVILTSKPVKWAKYNDPLVWYHANTVPNHALFMGRFRELPKPSFWRPSAQPITLTYPVTYKVIYSSDGESFRCHPVPLSEHVQDPELDTNETHHDLLQLAPTGTVSLLRS